MIVILGLVILVAAGLVGVAGVLSNGGSAHPLPRGFEVLGYHVSGSTGTLFLYGIVVGAVVLLGLSLLLAGARRTSRRGSAARRSLRQSRSETAAVSKDRDELIGQRDAARADTASDLQNGGQRETARTDMASELQNGGQRDTARAYTASKMGNGTGSPDPHLSNGGGHPTWMQLLGRRFAARQAAAARPEPVAARQAAAARPEPVAARPGPDVPADSSVRDVPAGTSAPAE